MEAIFSALLVVFSFYLLFFFAMLILGFVGIVFEFIFNYIVFIVFGILVIVFFVKYSKKIYLYLKRINTTLRPKTQKGVRIMMVLNILLYSGIGTIVDLLLLEIVSFIIVVVSIYYLIYPKKYFEAINGK